MPMRRQDLRSCAAMMMVVFDEGLSNVLVDRGSGGGGGG